MWFTLGSVVVGGTWGAFSLLADINHLKETSIAQANQIDALLERVNDVQVSVANARGEAGPAGPMRPEGPRGAAGEAVSMEVVQDMVKQAVAILPAATTVSGGAESNAATVIAQPGLFDFSQCVMLSDFQAAATAVVKKGLELCAKDGRRLIYISSAEDDRFVIRYGDSAGRSRSCLVHDWCSFDIDGAKQFLVDRVAMDDDGYAFLVRFE
jgi:hypothetical protein